MRYVTKRLIHYSMAEWKGIKTTRVNIFHEHKCKPTPKGVGGEGTRWHKVRPRRFIRDRDESNLEKYLCNIYLYSCYERNDKYGGDMMLLSTCEEDLNLMVLRKSQDSCMFY
jgi:hypothetical protein